MRIIVPTRPQRGLPASVAAAARICAALVLAACAHRDPPLPPPPVHGGGQTLFRILHDQCVPNERARGNPAPCALVVMDQRGDQSGDQSGDQNGGAARGYVLLKDRVGVAQYLLMPTRRITGIEDPALLEPEGVNYFARAWDQRTVLDARLGHPLERTRVSITVNSIYGRSQDQLHLHLDCLDADVAEALRRADDIGGPWSRAVVTLKGRRYHLRWIEGDRAPPDLFELLAQEMPGARGNMGAWTLALVGAQRRGGAPGFVALAARADPLRGDRGSAEELQDHSCR